jgi:hypothetical protein
VGVETPTFREEAIVHLVNHEGLEAIQVILCDGEVIYRAAMTIDRLRKPEQGIHFRRIDGKWRLEPWE